MLWFKMCYLYSFFSLSVGIIVFSDLQQLFSYIVVVIFIGGWTRGKPPSCRKSLTNTHCCIEYTSIWVKFELTTLVVIGTDYIGSCKSNYQTIMTKTALSVYKFCKYVRPKIPISWLLLQWLKYITSLLV